MVNQADEPLTKITLNLYTKDLEELKRYGNYSEAIRHIVRMYLLHVENMSRESNG